MTEQTIQELRRVVAFDQLGFVRQDMLALQVELAKTAMLPALQKRLETWSSAIVDAVETLKETAPKGA